MNAYHNKLCVYTAGLTKDPYTAQDIVQSVFLRVWEQREKLNAKYNIRNYLYRSVYNEFINQYRKVKFFTSLEKEHLKQLNFIVKDSDAETVRLIELVKNEVKNLPPKCRTIFTMGKMDGLSYTEIADIQNVSVRTVEMHMSRAFEIIRKRIGKKAEIVLFFLFGQHHTAGGSCDVAQKHC